MAKEIPYNGIPGFEYDHAGNRTCGHDFMGGTICTNYRGHEGPHSALCQTCEGDWMNNTCTCGKPEEDCCWGCDVNLLTDECICEP